MLVTALSPVRGYDKAAKLAHDAEQKKISLAEANQVLKFLSKEEFDIVVDPYKMTKGGLL
ncbi:class II fumarate hydratase, partial [Francisella tularensis subsp. holarctica]|nr:class II fumarate hydratase [Francisella tularensis subsp. holarctica]